MTLMPTALESKMLYDLLRLLLPADLSRSALMVGYAVATALDGSLQPASLRGHNCWNPREIQAMIAECRAQATSLEFAKFDGITHWSEVVFIGMGDQAHNNRGKGESTGGFVILAASLACKAGHVCRMSLLAWRTWKLKRRAVGSNEDRGRSVSLPALMGRSPWRRPEDPQPARL